MTPRLAIPASEPAVIPNGFAVDDAFNLQPEVGLTSTS